MTRAITFGLQTMPGDPWDEIVARWQQYEVDGWDSLWLPDHLMPATGQPGPFFEAWTALSALAALTTRVQIGHLVTSNTFRHPGILGKMAVTLDHISHGRAVLGLGAGWFIPEHDAFGIEFPETGERVSRYGEALSLLDRFLNSDTTNFEGAWYTLRDAPNRPAPVQAKLPIMVGAHGPRTINLAARYADIWNSRGTIEEMRERNVMLSAAAERAGRNPEDITRSAYYNPGRTDKRPWRSSAAFTNWVESHREIGFTDFLFEEPAPDELDSAREISIVTIPALRRAG